MPGKSIQQAKKSQVDSVAQQAALSERVPPAAPASPSPVRSITRVILRDWKRVVLTTIAVTAIAWSLAAMQPRRYRASVLASVIPIANLLEPNELLRSVEVLERRTVVATVAALAATPVTRTRAAVASGYRVEAVVQPNTNLFRVDVEGSDPTTAATIANRLPGVLDLQTRGLYKYYSVALVSPAVPPDAPFLPRTSRAIAAGLVIGLFLGLLAAYGPYWRASRRGNVA